MPTPHDRLSPELLPEVREGLAEVAEAWGSLLAAHALGGAGDPETAHARLRAASERLQIVGRAAEPLKSPLEGTSSLEQDTAILHIVCVSVPRDIAEFWQANGVLPSDAQTLEECWYAVLKRVGLLEKETAGPNRSIGLE